MESPDQTEPDRLEGLLRVTDLEDEISALVGKHRQLRVGLLVALIMVLGSAIGAWGGASAWIWAFVGLIVVLPWFLRETRAQMLTHTERKEDLLLQLEEVLQPDLLHAPDSTERDTE